MQMGIVGGEPFGMGSQHQIMIRGDKHERRQRRGDQQLVRDQRRGKLDCIVASQPMAHCQLHCPVDDGRVLTHALPTSGL